MTGDAAILALAARQLAENRRTGFDESLDLSYDFVCPSTAHYPFQWFWDSCFHAIVLTHIDVSLAELELLCLLQGARADGFIPHILFWEREHHAEAIAAYNLPASDAWTTDTIQTPLLATAVRRVWEAGRSAAFLGRALPPTLRYYRWLAANRDPDGDGLISIVQPDESGLDASPKYDAALGLEAATEDGLRRAMDRLFARYAPLRGDLPAMFGTDAFSVEDVMVNAAYADGLRDLEFLLRAAGDEAGAQRRGALAARVEAALLAKCWDAGSGAFWDLVGAREEPARVFTVTSLLPLILERLPRDVVQALVKTLTDPARFWSRFPARSVSASEPAYAPGEGIVWRGPTWLNTNWFLVRGLRRHGYNDVAERIAAASRDLVRRHGFREYYHPDTGEPGGAHGFGWSTLVVDM